MISENKKNSNFNKNIIDTYNYRLKTIAKISKNEKRLTIIQYFQSTFTCYAIVSRELITCLKLSVNNELHNKTFTNSNRKFLRIKKISPEQLLNYLQPSKDYEYITEDLNYFCGTLDISRSDDINFYIKDCINFFDDLLSTYYSQEILIRLMKYDCINRFLKLKQYLNNLNKKNLHSILITLFEEYFDSLIYLPEKFNKLSISNVTKKSNSFTLQLPKSKVLIEKKCIANRKKQYYSKINNTTLNFYINTLNEFLDAFAYFIIYHNITIKECKHCHRLFIPSRKDAIYCDNPCPEKPSKTCKQVRTHFSKRQTEQFRKISYLYDRIFTKCNNNKKKNPEYIKIWEIYKNMHNELMEDIYHSKLKQSAMIKLQNRILNDPTILLPKKEEKQLNISDDFDFMELHNKFIKEAEENKWNSIIEYLK